MNNIINFFMVAFVPGGGIVYCAVWTYNRFFKRSSHDTTEINYMLSNVVLLRHGKRNKGYAGSYTKLTDDISCVKVTKQGELYRQFKGE